MWRLEGVEPRTLAVKCELTIIRDPTVKLLILLEKIDWMKKANIKARY